MLGLRTTIYKVPDLAEAKNWYAKVFQVQPYFDEPFYVGFSIKGYELGLIPDEGDAAKADNVLAYWGVEDIESEFNRLIGLGAGIHEKPTNVGGDIVTATVYDPWKNVIGLIYNPEFKAEP
ncbi:MAG: VOC family protein [Cyclobacteriaceae bacterium]|nr:VOC family protein [Cyclobacteriaceae bacterium]